MSDSTDSPGVIEVLKSVLLPGGESLYDFAGKVKDEAGATEWVSSLNRIEGLAALFTIFGATLLVGYAIFDQTSPTGILKLIGLPSAIGLIIVLPLIYANLIMSILEKIEDGKPVLAPLKSENEKMNVAVKGFIGGTFLLLSIAPLVLLEMDLLEIMFLFIISSTFLGLFFIGFAYLAKAAIRSTGI